mgnify:CR=1 FL=1
MKTTDMSRDFLHSIPSYVNDQYNLTNVILLCAQTTSTRTRLTLYEQLLKILNEIA